MSLELMKNMLAGGLELLALLSTTLLWLCSPRYRDPLVGEKFLR